MPQSLLFLVVHYGIELYCVWPCMALFCLELSSVVLYDLVEQCMALLFVGCSIVALHRLFSRS